MISTQTLKGNLVLQDYTTAFTLNQGDKGVPFKIELIDNGTPYTLLDTDVVSIEWYKPNGQPFLQEGNIKYGTNYIEITTPEAIAQYSGSGTFNIIISDGTVRKGTIRREYKVIPTSMKPGSVSEDVITDAITELRELSVEIADTVQNNQDLINNNQAATKQDISNINSSLEDIANAEQYKYTKLQQKLYQDFLIKLKAKTGVKITCEGDSLTYGQDEVSTDKRLAKSDSTLDLTYTGHTAGQAGKTYPERLQEIMDDVYGSTVVTIANRGISGLATESDLRHWSVNNNSDITYIMLGTNDCNYNVDIETYIDNYDKIIRRKLDWGSAVVILTSPPTMNGEKDKMEPYRKSAYNLALKYNIPVIDTKVIFGNYTK